MGRARLLIPLRPPSMTIPRKLLFLLRGLLLAIGLVGVADAASPRVDERLTVALIQSNGNFEVATAATAARPGDVLEYATRYTNRGITTVDAGSPSMAIPTGTEYLPTDAAPKPTHASLDGATFLPIPLKRSLRGNDGVIHVVDVPPREYRALRWTVGTLAAGSNVVVRARVRLGQPDALASRW